MIARTLLLALLTGAVSKHIQENQELKLSTAPQCIADVSASINSHHEPREFREKDVDLTLEQLKTYYLIYEEPDVRYLRTVLNGYLANVPGKEDEFQLLTKWDKRYYRSKFVVLWREKIWGGSFLGILFQDRPDKVFVARVLEKGDGELRLGEFGAGNFSKEDLNELQIRYRHFLKDKMHAM